MNNVLKVGTGVVAGAFFATGALVWKGNTELIAAKQTAEEFHKAAVEFVENAKSVEVAFSNASDENVGLSERITELEEMVERLEKEAREMQAKEEKMKAEIKAKQELVDFTKNELKKANQEISKANKDASNHREEIEQLLDPSIFE